MQITTNGIVIKEKEFKGDRVLLLLTEDLGIVTAYAKGAKKPKSKFTSSTELFCYSQYVLTEKGENYWVDSADVMEVFFGLRSSIEKMSFGAYICEVSSYLSPKNDNAGEYLRLVLNSLKFIELEKRTYSFIKSVFELRILTMSGFMPDLVGCAVCGNFESDFMFFSKNSGQIVCNNCYEKSSFTSCMPISMGVLSAMRHIIYSSFDRLFAFKISDTALSQLSKATETYLLTHMDFAPKTLSFLQSVLAM